MKKITLLTILCMFLAIPIVVGQTSLTTSGKSGMSVQNPPAGTASKNHQNTQQTFNNASPIVITHSLSQTIKPGTVACGTGNVPAENNYYREFDLVNQFGVTSDLTVSSVEFGVESITGPINLTLNIYSTTAVFPVGFPGSLTLKGTANYTVTVADNLSIVSVPLTATIPLGSKMVYEIKINDGATDQFYLGSNDLGQSGTSWIKANTCSITVPTDIAAIGFPEVMMIMNVVGEADAGTPPITYCASSGGNRTWEHITNVTYAGINNTTTAPHPGYNDFTGQVATVYRGDTNQLSVRILADGGDHIHAFIDWNQNGILDDAGEVYIVAAGTGVPGPHTLNITVPAGADLGNTRMRVMAAWNRSVPNPCGTFAYGEVEDYTVNVQVPVIGNPPVIVCPADISANNDAGLCSAIVNFSDAIAIDVEDGVIATTQTAGPASGSAFPVGVTTVEFTATDSDGNVVTCQFDVTVLDTQAPVAVCKDITIDLDPVTGMASITGADVDNGSSDNCGIDTITLSQSSFGCGDIGANTVTVTVTDNSGNTSTCTTTVTVQDTTAPEVVCVGGFATFSEQEDFEGASIPVGWTTVIESGAHDWEFGSGTMPFGPSFTSNAAIFDDDSAGSGSGANKARLVSPAYDLTGASNVELSFDYALKQFIGDGTLEAEVWNGTAWQSILFVDADQPPINSGIIDASGYANAAFQVRFTYDDDDSWAWGAGVDSFLLEYEKAGGGGLDVYLDANGHATISPNDLVLSVTEACNYTITAAGTGGGTTGSLTTMFVAGNNGDPGNAVYFDITVGPSDIEITDIDVNTAGNDAFTMNVYTIAGSYVGNETNQAAWTMSSTASGVAAGNNNPSPAVLASPITLTANTSYGIALVLDATHAHYYTNGDGSNQNFSNADMSMTLGSASNVPFTAPLFAPRIFNGTIHYIGGAASGLDFTCADLGENIIEVTVTDDSGNSTTCMAIVNVYDITAPIIVCAGTPGPNSEVEDFEGNTIPSGWTSEIQTGNRDWTFGTGAMPTGGSFPSKAAIFNDDAAGSGEANKATLMSPVYNITGSTNTSISFDYAFQEYLGDGKLTVEAYDGTAWQQVFYVDTNTNPTNTGSLDMAAFVNANFQVRFIYDDEGGWSWGAGIDNFTVNYDVSVATPVDIELGPNGTTTIDPYSLVRSIDEACGISSIAIDVPVVTCADIGAPINVTIFVSDASGNIASCTTQINVVDRLAPVITCPANQTQDPGTGNLYYIVPDYFATGEATAIDNCTDPVTIFTQSPAAGTPLSDGTYTITLTAEDEYGNVSTCSFQLKVESVLGVAENNLEKGVMLYPNPASSIVNLVNKTNLSLDKMVIFDINGKMISQIDLRSMQGEKSVDVSSFASGVYMVQIIGEDASTVKRLIIE